MNESPSSSAALTEQVRGTLAFFQSAIIAKENFTETVAAQFCESIAALDALAEALAQTEKERDALRDAVDSFVRAYPESVFPEYGPGELPAAIAAIKEAGVSSERLHASWARHVSKSIVRLALAAGREAS